MNRVLDRRVLVILFAILVISSCKKATSTDLGTGSGSGSGGGTTQITETATSVLVGGQSLPAAIVWLGRHNGQIYGHAGSVVFRLNPATKLMEEAFRISFPGLAISDVWPRFMKLTTEGDLFVAVKAPGNSTVVARLNLQGQKVWTKRINFTYNQFYGERHIDARSLNVFDNAVWLNCLRALVKLDIQTGALLASQQLPFAAQEIVAPVDVLPVGNQVMIYCRNSLQHLDFFFFDKNTLNFSHSLGRKIVRNTGSGSSANHFTVNNAFVLSNNRLLFLSDYTHTGNAFFPISFGLLTDFDGNVIRAKYFTNHLNNIVEISPAHRHTNGRFFAMIASDVDINITYTYNIVSVDESLSMIQSEALIIGGNRNGGLLSPFPIDDNQVVVGKGNTFYWLNYQRIGCSKDPAFKFSVPQMDMEFTSIVRTTTPPSFAPGISVQSTADADMQTERLAITSNTTECKK